MFIIVKTFTKVNYFEIKIKIQLHCPLGDDF